MTGRIKGAGTPPEIPARREVIHEEVGCRRCGYLLKGLTVSGECPECGTAIQGWLGATDRLFTARPGAITRMQWAIYLFMMGLLLGCVDLSVMAFRAEGEAATDGVSLVGVWDANRVAEGLEWVRLNAMLLTVPALLTMCLVPYAADTASVMLRVCRWVAMAALAVAWCGAAWMVVRYATVGWSVPMAFEPAVLGGAFVMWCAGVTLMMPCMREVARRMRQEGAQRILRVLPVQAWCVITVGVVAFALASAGLDLTMIALVIVLWGAGVLAGFLWALVLIAGELGREAGRSEIYHNEMEEMEPTGR